MEILNRNLSFLHQTRPDEDHGRGFYITRASKAANNNNINTEESCWVTKRKRKELEHYETHESQESECKFNKTEENDIDVVSSYARNWMNKLTAEKDEGTEYTDSDDFPGINIDSDEDVKENTPPGTLNRSNDQYTSSTKYTEDRFTSQLGDKSQSKKKSKSKELSKKLQNINNKIEEEGAKAEASKGYRLSFADKMQFEDPDCLMFQQVDLLLKQGLTKSPINKKGGESSPQKKKDIKASLKPKSRFTVRSSALEDKDRLLEKMKSLRLEAGRPESLDEMSGEELQEEKGDMQKQLNIYERIHGLQDRQENRNVMAEVYERYRLVLRLTRRYSSPRCSVTSLTLGSIPEDQTLEMSGSEEITLDHHNDRKTKNICGENWSELSIVQLFKKPDEVEDFEHLRREEFSKYHTMTKFDLMAALRSLKNEKKEYRKKIKRIGDKFERDNGRNFTKEDRETLDEYKLYKQVKHKIRFIDALLCKFSTVHLDH